MRHPILSVVTPPEPVISTAEAKAHLRVETTDDDALIAGMVAGATLGVDGPTGWLGRALGTQTIVLIGSHFPCAGALTDWRFGRGPDCEHHEAEIRLPCPPVQEVKAVTYLDPIGVPRTLDPSAYALVDRFLFPLPGFAWPATQWRPAAVSVTYVAGYPDGGLPETIKSALLLKVGALYTGRNDGPAIGQSASDSMLSPLRVFT